MNIKSALSLHMKGEHDVAKYSSLCAKGYFVNNYRKLNLYEVWGCISREFEPTCCIFDRDTPFLYLYVISDKIACILYQWIHH